MKIEYNQEEVRQRVAKVIELGNYKSTRSFSIDVGLACSNLSKMLRCKQNFTKAAMMAICSNLKVDLQWLAYGKGDAPVMIGQIDDATQLRIEKARLEERVQCLENEKAFLQRMLEK